MNRLLKYIYTLSVPGIPRRRHFGLDEIGKIDMGCLSSAQASPTVVTIENRQRSNASSLPPKHEQSQVHEDRSWVEPEVSKKQFKGKAQIETKPNVFVSKREDTHDDDRRSRSEESVELYNEPETDKHVIFNGKEDDGRRSRSEESIELYKGLETDENVIYNVEEATDIAKTNQSEQELPKQDHKMDKANNKERSTPKNSDVIQRHEVDDVTQEYPTVYRNSRHGNKSEDTDSGFENPEIASVSAYSPDDNSDDDMF